MILRVLQLMYVTAPAYAANMAPPFLRYWKGWNRPISARWLGNHKTVLGFATGILAAVLVSYVQSRIGWEFGVVDHDEGWLLLGGRLGLGAMIGDSVKSFFKRRVGVPPGRSWIPFDQLDFVVGALLFSWGALRLAWSDVVLILLVSVVGHILVNHIGYWLGIRDAAW